MNFVYPQFLWAFSLLAIPIIIHLFRFRRFKKINFSNTSFLASVVIEKQNQNKLKNLILLFVRILTIILLVLAFSQPYFSDSEKSRTKKIVNIYIDNSPSMENINKEGALIDQAKQIAKQIIKGHGKNDKFLIISNNFKYKEQQYYSFDDALQLVDEVQLSPYNRNYQSIYEKISSLAEEYPQFPKALYIISDFQKSNGEPDKLPASTSEKIFLAPLFAASLSNLSIDSCWFSSPFVYPMKPVTLNVNIRNYGNTEFKDITLDLNLDGKNKVISFDISENENKTIEIPLIIDRTGWFKCSLSITDYPVTFDDIYYFSFNINESCNILNIIENKTNQFLNLAYSTDAYFRVINKQINNIEALSNYQLIVLNELSTIPSSFVPLVFEFIRNGGTLLIIPATDNNININSYNNLCKTLGITQFEQNLSNATKIQKMNVEHLLFYGVFEKKQEKIDFPVIKKAYSRASSTMSTEYPLMNFENNEPFLTIANAGKGVVFTLSVPFNQSWSNLVNHPVFVPLLYQMALYKNNYLPLALTLGKDKVFELPQSEIKQNDIKVNFSNYKFTPKTNFVAGSMIFQIDDNFKDAGFYKIQTDKQHFLAFNHNRVESKPDNYSYDDLKITQKNNPNIKVLNAMSPNLQQKIKEQNEGRIIWKFLIWIVLIFLLAEVLITRFFRKI